MTSYIAVDLRRLVADRAKHLCEYCLISETDTYLGCQVDHIISVKHGGLSEEANLCLACTFCNQAKGTDIGSLAASSGEFTRFYNPRSDRWDDHFSHAGVSIQPRTAIGEVTAALLQFNTRERLSEREALSLSGRYPPKRI